MSSAACKVVIDGGNYNGSARHSADAAQTFKELALLALPDMTDEQVARTVAFSQKMCDWHIVMEKWTAEIQAENEWIHETVNYYDADDDDTRSEEVDEGSDDNDNGKPEPHKK